MRRKFQEQISDKQEPLGELMDQETIRSLTDEAVRFRDERNWKQFHNPKDMAISLSLEVAELLELMQWKNGDALDRHLVERRKEAGEELSDILYWILLLAHDWDIDLVVAFKQKMTVNKTKYPADKARNSSKKYNELSADGTAEKP